MNFKLFFLFFSVIINTTFNNASEKNDPFLKILRTENWVVFANKQPFFKPKTLTIEDISNPSNLTKLERSIYSEEESKTIIKLLSEMFKKLPCGYQDCLFSILTGANDQEALRLTPFMVAISDKYKKHTISDLRKNEPCPK